MKVSRTYIKNHDILLPLATLRQRLLVTLLIPLLVFTSCQPTTFDTKEALFAHIADPENGYVQQRSVNGVDFSVTYRPTDLLVAQELPDTASESEIDSLRKKYGDYLYFNLTLSQNQKEVLSGLAGNRSEFGAMVNQLAFGMGDKVHLFSKKKDTVALADYVYPRLYGMGGGTSMLFVYPRDPKLFEDDFFHMTLEDIGLQTGEIGFKISTAKIKDEPRLVF